MTAVYWADRFPERRPEHFVFPACENGQVDPSRGIANWRTAWRRITGSIQCPVCGETQNPGKKCRNVECGAKIPDIKNPLEGLRFHSPALHGHKAFGTGDAYCSCGAYSRMVGQYRSANGQALWSYPTGSTAAGFGGSRHARNSDRCAPICAPTRTWVTIDVA